MPTARTIANDPYQSFNFRISTLDDLNGGQFTEAAFVTCTLPELTIDGVEYKESDGPKKKFPGFANVNDITMTKGMVKTDSNMFKIAMSSQKFDATLYRTTIVIKQGHRDGTTRVWTLYNAFCVRCKVGSDLDANSADMSIEEMDWQYESFDVSERTDALSYGPAGTKTE